MSIVWCLVSEKSLQSHYFATMAVVGIDFGNLSVLIGQAGRGGVDVILNDSSNRQTATCVSIQGKQRFLGDSGAAMARSNITNTFSCMKLLVGRRFDSPDVQDELKRAPFKASKLPNGAVGINVLYNNEDTVVPVEHIMAMMLVKAKDVAAKANGNVGIADAVLAVPHWFTDAQKRGVLNACEIADLHCIKVADESTLIALSYGIFKSAKKLFSETEPMHIMFIDLGYTGYSVSIVDFIQENMRVLATVNDRTLGGRDFDDVIIEFLSETFQKKTGIDVRGNMKAWLKLQVAAEKAKKTLSPAGVNEAAVSVECLADDKDLSCVLTKEEFELRVAGLLHKLEAPVLKCLEEAGLQKADLVEIEVVGGSVRVNAVKRKLGEVLGVDPNALNFGLKTTMNSDEAVARGGALQAAMMSSRMKVKPFHIVDKVPYGIVVNFDSATRTTVAVVEGDDKEVSTATGGCARLYARGDDLPAKAKRLSFHDQTGNFTVTAMYDGSAEEFLPPGEDKTVGKYTIKVPAELVASGPKQVRVTFALDKHSLFYVQRAQLMEELPAEAEGKEGETKMDVSEGKEGEAAAPKRRYKKHDLVVVSDVFGMTREQVKASLELEASMAFEDKLIVETADKRNELEAYLYSMRDKLDGGLKPYCTEAERSQLQAKMTDAEDWLYGDGFDSTKQLYTKKIDELRALSDPIEHRLNEELARQPAIEQLQKQISLCKSFLSNYDDCYAHITEEERDSLRTEVSRMESWLQSESNKQNKVRCVG